jgi:hypothetical protein
MQPKRIAIEWNNNMYYNTDSYIDFNRFFNILLTSLLCRQLQHLKFIRQQNSKIKKHKKRFIIVIFVFAFSESK